MIISINEYHYFNLKIKRGGKLNLLNKCRLFYNDNLKIKHICNGIGIIK